ncbi:hypothetical protein GGR58DRAFT_502481 [Xylaria digitata]|nr:hypothetical protein GGR58DRAFT_502481 [Xylaria digitata]
MDSRSILNETDFYPTGLEDAVEQLEALARIQREEIYRRQDYQNKVIESIKINNRLSYQQKAPREEEVETGMSHSHDNGIYEDPSLQDSLLNSPPTWEYPITNAAATPWFENPHISGTRETTTRIASTEFSSSLPPPPNYVPPSLEHGRIFGGIPSAYTQPSFVTGPHNAYSYCPRPPPSPSPSPDYTYDSVTPEFGLDDFRSWDHTAASKNRLPPLRSVIPEIDLNPPPSRGHATFAPIMAHQWPQRMENRWNRTRPQSYEWRNRDIEDTILRILTSSLVILEITRILSFSNIF